MRKTIRILLTIVALHRIKSLHIVGLMEGIRINFLMKSTNVTLTQAMIQENLMHHVVQSPHRQNIEVSIWLLLWSPKINLSQADKESIIIQKKLRPINRQKEAKR
jgi:hypothetical protein